MKLVAGLVLMLVNVRLSHSCIREGPILICLERIPPAFSPGISSLVLSLKDLGEINSTVLRSDHLASVSRLRMENAGVTGIAEGAFSSFQNLTDLSLTQNLLTEMNPLWLGRPDLLSQLSLAQNQIQVLTESMLTGLSHLLRLNLSKNKIRTVAPNSFRSNTILAELDLSDNRMTRASPQVFGSLSSTRIRLDGNPWDCSCGAEDSVDFLKDLHNRSLLDRPMEVTCESPPSLRGQRVWNVSVCVTSPPPLTPSVTPTVQLKPPDDLTAGPASTPATPSRATSETETSAQPKHTAAPTVMSSHAATPSARPPLQTKTSVQPKPTTTPALKTATFATHVTSPPSVTEISVRPKPPDLSRTTPTPTETCATSRPSSDTKTVCTLVVVIVVLLVLLFLACFLAVLRRRKRNNKTVTPGRPEENRKELKDDSRSSRAQSPDHSEKKENHQWDSETEGWRRSFTGVRAKSANAILFMSPVRDQVTSQTETEAQTTDAENKAEGRQKLGDDGGFETENDADVIKDAKQADAGKHLDENPHCVSANTDTVPYLSIGTIPNKPSPDECNKQSTDAGQRSQRGNVMGRISTWPPTAVQWQARCKMKEEEKEEGSDVFTDWTLKFPGEVKKEEQPLRSDRDKQEDELKRNQPLKFSVAHVTFGLAQPLKPNDETSSLSEDVPHTDTRLEEQQKEEKVIQDPDNVTQNLNRGPNQDLKSADKDTAQKNSRKSSNKAEQRSETGAVMSRHRAAKAPSGGASPDDETLLSGNEYAFMDLLHEVSQNNGRWTRDRWRQIHVNKQRRQDRGTEGE